MDNTTFLLPILEIGLISGDKPLLLLETRGSKEMKRRSKMKEKEGYCFEEDLGKVLRRMSSRINENGLQA